MATLRFTVDSALLGELFIDKSSPCNCRQFVRFGLSQGWLTKEALTNYRPPIALKTKKEITELKTLRDIYSDLSPERADESLVRRIREGIKNKEWAVIS